AVGDQHCVQVVDRAGVVEQRRLADHADDHRGAVALVPVHLVPGGAGRGLQEPGVVLRAGAAHDAAPWNRNDPTSSSRVATGGRSQRSRMFSWKRPNAAMSESGLCSPSWVAMCTKLTPSSSLNVA